MTRLLVLLAASALLAACSLEAPTGADDEVGPNIDMYGVVTVGRGLPGETAFVSASFTDLGLLVPRDSLEPEEDAVDPDVCIVDEAPEDPFSGGGAPAPLIIRSVGDVSAGDAIELATDGTLITTVGKLEGDGSTRYEHAYPAFTTMPDRLALSAPGDVFPAFDAVDILPVDDIEGFEPGILGSVTEGSTFSWTPPSTPERGGRIEITATNATQMLTCIVADDGEFSIADAERFRSEEPFAGGELRIVTRSVETIADVPYARLKVLNQASIAFDLELPDDAGASDPLLPTTSRIDGPPPAPITTIGEIGAARDTEVPGVTLTRVSPGEAHRGARHEPWNLDETRLLLGGQIVDAVTLEPIATVPPELDADELFWSGEAAEVILALSGNAVYRWDTETNTTTVLATAEGASTCSFHGGEPSWNDRFAVLLCDTSTLVALDLELGFETGRLELGYPVSWVSASPSGRYAVVQRRGESGSEELVRFERDLGGEQLVLLDPAEGDLGIDDIQQDVFVMSGPVTPRYVRLVDGAEVILGVGDAAHPLGGGSVSCVSARTGWCYFSSPLGWIGTARLGIAGTTPQGLNALGNTIYPGLAIWEHWGYSRSSGAVAPSAAASPSGRQLIFTSDLGGSTNTYVLAFNGGGAGAMADADACAAFPAAAHSPVSRADWDSYIGKTSFTRNGHLLSIVPDGGQGALRHRFEATPRGTERVTAKVRVPEAQTYTLTQNVLFEPGFSFTKGGKLGFGIGGGSLPTGGSTSRDGWSARFYWRGNRDGTADIIVYSYQADRPGQYGLGHPFGSFAAVDNQWIEMSMEVTLNSSPSRADGTLRGWIDGQLMIDKGGIAWQTQGAPVVDTLMYSTFHGGGDPSWSPPRPEYARFRNVCWRAG